MSIFPFITYDEEVTTSNVLPTYHEVAWDYYNNDIVIQNGNPVIVEGNEAIKVWCYKALNTSRYNHYVYSWDYGTELQDLIGKSYTKDLTESEAKRYIEEALMINPYIEEVRVTSCTFDRDTLSAKVVVKTIYEGEVEIDV